MTNSFFFFCFQPQHCVFDSLTSIDIIPTERQWQNALAWVSSSDQDKFCLCFLYDYNDISLYQVLVPGYLQPWLLVFLCKSHQGYFSCKQTLFQGIATSIDCLAISSESSKGCDNRLSLFQLFTTQAFLDLLPWRHGTGTTFACWHTLVKVCPNGSACQLASQDGDTKATAKPTTEKGILQMDLLGRVAEKGEQKS